MNKYEQMKRAAANSQYGSLTGLERSLSFKGGSLRQRIKRVISYVLEQNKVLNLIGWEIVVRKID